MVHIMYWTIITTHFDLLTKWLQFRDRSNLGPLLVGVIYVFMMPRTQKIENNQFSISITAVPTQRVATLYFKTGYFNIEINISIVKLNAGCTIVISVTL